MPPPCIIAGLRNSQESQERVKRHEKEISQEEGREKQRVCHDQRGLPPSPKSLVATKEQVSEKVKLEFKGVEVCDCGRVVNHFL